MGACGVCWAVETSCCQPMGNCTPTCADLLSGVRAQESQQLQPRSHTATAPRLDSPVIEQRSVVHLLRRVSHTSCKGGAQRLPAWATDRDMHMLSRLAAALPCQ